MKILFCTSSFRGGGISSYAIEVLHYLMKEHSVSVFIGDDSMYPLKGLDIKVYNIESEDVSIVNAKKAIQLINNVICPDVIINSNSRLTSLIAPFILDSIFVMTVSHSLKYIETDISAISHQYTDIIIALSESSKNYICNRFRIKDKAKIRVVYNFVPSVDGVEDIIAQKKTADPLRIVYMGGSSGAKSPDIVFKVLKELLKTSLPFQFTWLGESTTPMKRIQFWKEVKSFLPHDDRIIFPGRVPREQSMQIASTANILLIPSRREGCPMALLETIRCGVISITADFKTACSEIIENEKNGFVIPAYRIDEYVKRIKDIILNHKNYLKLYDSSYATFVSSLSYNAWSNKMSQIIDNPVFNHTKRNAKFNTIKYLLRRIKLLILDIDNIIDWLFNESLKSAIPFLIEYFKQKYEKKNNTVS